MSSASEKANLARIRDNQRRSRARRKEYLQELEARLRQCELQGIEASSEIQIAARRVADENKKLRALLAQQGIGEDNIEAYLQASSSDAMMGSSYVSSGAVQILEQLLQTRKLYCTDGTNPIPVNAGGSRDSSASVGTVSVWDHTYTQDTSGRRRSGSLQQQGGRAASAAQQFMTPSTSAASGTGSVVSLGSASNRGVSRRHQNLSSMQTPRNISPNLNHAHQNHQSMFDFDSQVAMSNSYSQHQNTAHKHLQPLDNSQRMYMSQSTNANVNNCNYAADIITSMAGVVDPSAVRADLGCLPDGMECEVDNQLVFNVLDRYSGVGL